MKTSGIRLSLLSAAALSFFGGASFAQVEGFEVPKIRASVLATSAGAGDCYEPSNVGRIGEAGWTGNCEGMLIVNRELMNTATPVSGGIDKAISHTTGSYTFGNGPKTIFTGQVTNMSALKLGATFNADISHWSTGRVVNMSTMFMGATTFNQPIGGWDTSKVANMGMMFYGAAAFNQPIGTWNTSNVTGMTGVFQQASSFNQPIGGWDTSRVMDMGWMFYRAAAFNQPLGGWNTSRVALMNSMFHGAAAFNQPLGGWNTSRVTLMDSMFYDAVAFNQNLSSWVTGSATQPAAFSIGANLDFHTNTNQRKPFLKGGFIRFLE